MSQGQSRVQPLMGGSPVAPRQVARSQTGIYALVRGDSTGRCSWFLAPPVAERQGYLL